MSRPKAKTSGFPDTITLILGKVLTSYFVPCFPSLFWVIHFIPEKEDMQFGTCVGNTISFSVRPIMWLGHPHIHDDYTICWCSLLGHSFPLEVDPSPMSPVESPAYEVYHEGAC